jgi:hypothetical protein
VDEVAGHPEARGATIAGTQVHSVRLPSFVVSTRAVFALPDERLTIRHDAGSSPVSVCHQAPCSRSVPSPRSPAWSVGSTHSCCEGRNDLICPIRDRPPQSCSAPADGIAGVVSALRYEESPTP